MVFLTQLATNATARGVSIVLYSGNNDALIAHRGTESQSSRLLLLLIPGDNIPIYLQLQFKCVMRPDALM